MNVKGHIYNVDLYHIILYTFKEVIKQMDLNKVVKAVRPNEIIEARFNLKPKENDIIDIVLSKIENDNNHKYNINVSEYIKLYKKGKTNAYRDLKSATESIYEKELKIKVDNKIIRMRWFSAIAYDSDTSSIVIELGETLKQLLLKVKEDKSKRIYYDITYPLNFKSIYSKRLYYMLKSFEPTGFRVDKLEDLKAKLECNSKTYEQYKHFKYNVLEKAKDEINKNSDIEFSFEGKKEQGKVVRVEFTIWKNDNAEVANAETCCTKENTQSENDILAQQVKDVVPNVKALDIKKILKAYNNNIEKITKAYNYTRKQSETRTIKSVVAYMISIKNSNLENITMDNSNFNNFKQRECNFECIEINNCNKDENIACKDCELYQDCSKCKLDSSCVMK